MRVKMCPVLRRPSSHWPARTPSTTEIASEAPKYDATATDWRMPTVDLCGSNGDLAMPCRVSRGQSECSRAALRAFSGVLRRPTWRARAASACTRSAAPTRSLAPAAPVRCSFSRSRRTCTSMVRPCVRSRTPHTSWASSSRDRTCSGCAGHDGDQPELGRRQRRPARRPQDAVAGWFDQQLADAQLRRGGGTPRPAAFGAGPPRSAPAGRPARTACARNRRRPASGPGSDRVGDWCRCR